jgi:TP901 family phage tail tape measure protein
MADKDNVHVDLTFRARTKRFDRDAAKLEKRIKRLEKQPINLQVRINTKGITAQARKAARKAEKELGKIQIGGGGGGGKRSKTGNVFLPDDFKEEVNRAKKAGKEISRTTQNLFTKEDGQDDLKHIGRTTSALESLDSGLRRTTITSEKFGKSGLEISQVVKKIADTTPIKKFEKDLRNSTKSADKLLSTATRTGDGDQLLKGLEKRRNLLQNFLSSPDATPFQGENSFRKAGDQLDRINSRIDTLRGKSFLKDQADDAKKNIESFEKKSRKIIRDTTPLIKNQQGGNDVDGQTAGLKKQRGALRALLGGTKDQDVLNSGAFRTAEKKVDDLNNRLANLSGRKDEKNRNQQYNKQISAAERTLKSDLARLDTQRQSNKLIKNEGEMRVAQAKNSFIRNNTLDRARTEFSEIAKRAKLEGRNDTSDRALRRRDNVDTTIAQRKRADLKDSSDRNKNERKVGLQKELDVLNAQTAARRQQLESAQRTANLSGTDNQKLEKQTRLLDQQKKLYESSSKSAKDIGERAENQGFKEVARTAQKNSRKYSQESANTTNKSDEAQAIQTNRRIQQQLDQRLRTIKQITAEKIAQSRALQRTNQSRHGSNAATREKELKAGLERERAILQTAQSQSSKISNESKQQGFGALSRQASTDAARYGNKIIETQGRVDAATKKSGRAFNFHSSSLLRNMGSFARWQLAAAAVLAPLAAIAAGTRAAIRADRQYATLSAVFQGTSNEARQLKIDTLDLAAANGRSAEEALDAAIAWSRLGLSRSQTNELIETSLRAANVGEIEAGEATRKLIAVYKAFNLEVGEVPQTLDRLNALTNRYAVTLTDLFEGVARAGALSKQAGLELVDLEGIITSVTAATGRPGQEVGNSIKFLTTRLRRPETLGKLNDIFDIDLTGPNGDILTMSEILAKLAQIYPNLSRSQQAYFLDIAAGSRQANRLALILGNWTESQIAATRALGDTNSAARENEKITGSLSSQLAQLSAEWTKLISTMGDSGVFNYIGGVLTTVKDAMADLNDESANTSSGNLIKINDRGLQRTIGNNLGKGKDFLGAGRAFMTDAPSRTKEELEEALAVAKLILKVFADVKNIKENNDTIAPDLGLAAQLDSYKKLSYKIGSVSASSLIGNITIGGDFEDELKRAEHAAEGIQGLLSEAFNIDAANDLTKITTFLNDQRSKVQQFQKANSTLGLIEFDINNQDADLGKIDKQMQSLRDTIETLPGGVKLAATTLPLISEALAEGKIDEATTLVKGLGTAFREEIPKGTKVLEEASKKAISTTTSLLSEAKRNATALNKTLAEADGSESDGLKQQVKEATAVFQELQDKIREIKKSAADLDGTPISFDVEESQGIARLAKRTTAIAEALAQATKDLKVSGADNVDRDFVRNLTGERVKLAILQEQLRVTQEREAVDSKTRARGINEAELEIYTREIIPSGNEADDTAVIASSHERIRLLNQERDIAEQIITKKQSEIKEEEASVALKRQALIDTREAGRLQEAFEQGGQRAALESTPFAFGRSEADKAINEARSIIRQSQSQEGFFSNISGDTSATSIAAERGAALTREARLRENINSLAQREAEIQQEIGQRASDKTDEDFKQLDAAEKKFRLASREEQIRAAAAANIVESGGLSSNEFTFLSQQSRQTFDDYYPNETPKKRDRFDEDRKLTEELRTLRQALPGLRDTLRETTTRNNNLQYGATPGQFGLNTQPVQDARRQGFAVNPQIELGGINIRVTIAEQLNPIIEDITQKIGNQVNAQITQAINAARISQPIDVGAIQSAARAGQ